VKPSRFSAPISQLLLRPDAEVVLGRAVRRANRPPDLCDSHNRRRLTRAGGHTAEPRRGRRRAPLRSWLPTTCVSTTGVLDRREAGRLGCCYRPDPSAPVGTGAACVSARELLSARLRFDLDRIDRVPPLSRESTRRRDEYWPGLLGRRPRDRFHRRAAREATRALATRSAVRAERSTPAHPRTEERTARSTSRGRSWRPPCRTLSGSCLPRR
jgi:hypothetical protein